MKFCESIKPGFYLTKDRCIYCSGKTKGNKWIYLNCDNPEWGGLLWNCIDREEIRQATYSIDNPTEFNSI